MPPLLTGSAPISCCRFHPTPLVPAGAEEVEKLEQYVKKLGGIIRTATPAWKILTTDDGRVSGVAAADGKNRFTFHAKSVVLASGGFAADLMKVTSRQPRWAVYVERCRRS